MTKTTAVQYRSFYVSARNRVKKWRADYDAAVKAWYDEGDGRSPEWVEAGTQDWFSPVDDPSRMVNIGGEGYTYPECIHGMSRWTDYDNICGGCESGETDIQIAQGMARSQFERFSWVVAAPYGLPAELKNELFKWALETF